MHNLSKVCSFPTVVNRFVLATTSFSVVFFIFLSSGTVVRLPFPQLLDEIHLSLGFKDEFVRECKLNDFEMSSKRRQGLVLVEHVLDYCDGSANITGVKVSVGDRLRERC